MIPIRLEDGAVAIGGRPVLRHVDLTVPEGQFLALMGANGSGKTTLVRALVGLRALTTGRLWLFDTPFADFRDWRRVGYVPQRSALGGGVPASVWEVVAAGRLNRRPLLRPLRRTDRQAVREAIEAVGLAGRERDPIATLSGGQQQRALIARSLAGEPDLFLLDEPTAGVDLANQEALARALATLTTRGATVVLVAHELGPLAPLVDRAVVLRDGRTVYDGAPLDDHAVHHPQYGEAHTHHHVETATTGEPGRLLTPFFDDDPSRGETT